MLDAQLINFRNRTYFFINPPKHLFFYWCVTCISFFSSALLWISGSCDFLRNILKEKSQNLDEWRRFWSHLRNLVTFFQKVVFLTWLVFFLPSSLFKVYLQVGLEEVIVEEVVLVQEVGHVLAQLHQLQALSNLGMMILLWSKKQCVSLPIISNIIADVLRKVWHNMRILLS